MGSPGEPARVATAGDSAVTTRPGVLRGPRRFAGVRAWRAQRVSGTVRVAAAPNPAGIVRVGFAIRDVRPAVLRNRLRRRLRAATRTAVTVFPGMDFVISAGMPAAMAPYPVLAADVAGGVRAAAELAARRMTQRAGAS